MRRSSSLLSSSLCSRPETPADMMGKECPPAAEPGRTDVCSVAAVDGEVAGARDNAIDDDGEGEKDADDGADDAAPWIDASPLRCWCCGWGGTCGWQRGGRIGDRSGTRTGAVRRISREPNTVEGLAECCDHA